jgi:class 3 adenylate cyclase
VYNGAVSAPAIDESLLDAKLAELEQARPWSARVIAKLEALLHAPDDVTLVRVNPFAFGRDKGIAAQEAVDLFLHAARLGIFTMDWHLLCPQCGLAVESFGSLCKLHHDFVCHLCNLSVQAKLDDFIQVSFTVAAPVRRLRHHDPASLAADDYLFNLRFTRELHVGSPDGPRLVDFMRRAFVLLRWIEAGETVRSTVEAEAGLLSALEFQAHEGAEARVRPSASAHELHFVIDDGEMTVSPAEVAPGPLTITVANRRSRRLVWGAAIKPQLLLDQGMDKSGLVFEPMVTGALLLTNQTFRRLFRTETVQSSEGIGVRDVTVLFTDLKGSTEMYERIGDLRAFAMVQQHFQRLGAVVAAHDGAIVKTIGDAVMAAFARPADAVRAALAMQQQIEAFNREHGDQALVLKIGIHRGPSIAVTLNESLDYFGHTVNVAARVQGVAEADEICVTDAVYRSEGVAALLASVQSEDARLRGVSKEVRVHRARRGERPSVTPP